MTDSAFVEENQAARQELADLIAQLDERSLHRAVGSGWTVSTLLCHLAFWDRMALSLLKEWQSGGHETPRLSTLSIDSINAAVRTVSQAVPGTEAARLALDSAAAVDSMVEGISDELCSQIVRTGFERSLRRSLHRREHLQKIKTAC
jgi:hypothetical protein